MKEGNQSENNMEFSQFIAIIIVANTAYYLIDSDHNAIGY